MTSPAFAPTKTAKVNGATLAYRERGKGEPVVFVHGALSDFGIWENQLPVIGGSYRAIAYSRRYARPNEDIDPGADDPMLPHVEDLAAFLREIGAAPAHLVGNSWGAAICLFTAVRHPDVVRTLVLEEPPLPQIFGVSMPARPTEFLRLVATQPRAAIMLVKFVAGTMAPVTKAFQRGEDDKALRIFLQGVLGVESFEKIPEAIRVRARENLSTLRAQMLHPEHPPLSLDEVRGIRAPALLVTGQLSPRMVIPLTDRLEELLPVVERVEIPNASHIMHEENPAAVNEAILGFLAKAT